MIEVGEVVSIKGIKITFRVYEQSNRDTIFYKGEKFKGVSIREYVAIQRGFREIVCMVEGELLDERKYEIDGNSVSYVRLVEAKPLGFFEKGVFYEGVKHMPMIKDPVFLLSEESIKKIYSRGGKEFVIGDMLKEDLPVSLPWEHLFNTHIGIFGNTGSGKSNTLAKLYTTLLEQKAEVMSGKSLFVLLDFNGEYSGGQLAQGQFKRVINLSTNNDNGSRFPLSENEFWDLETLSILFQATPNTQKPFLNRVIINRRRYADNPDSLKNFFKYIFKLCFTSASPHPDTLDSLRNIASILELRRLSKKLAFISWHSNRNKFYRPSDNNFFDPDGATYARHLEECVNQADLSQLSAFEELKIRCELQLIQDVLGNFVQYDYIQPVLKRMESSLSSLKRVLTIDDQYFHDSLLTVISLKSCNQETKKIMPMLIAKYYYTKHKAEEFLGSGGTLHVIIDEAHNILSQQSTRESESWKDYRLELFEEIIKEGRKFGIYLTISSQRPSDISPTIISQVHNFFIHRLVNDRDLFLLDNTISTLDSFSRSLIPNLAKGSCVITGSTFDIPMLIQIRQLKNNQKPDSDDIDLTDLWSLE